VAAANPAKVKELQAAFTAEAKKYDVLPLDDRLAERFDASLRPNPLAGRTSFTYGPGATNISESATLNTHGVPFSVTADVEVGSAGSDGVLAAIGGITSGWTLYVKNRKPTFAYNFFEVEHYRARSSEPLPKGRSKVRVDFTPVEPGPGKPAVAKLFVNGQQTGEVQVKRTVPFRYGVEPFDVGMDNVSAVSEEYQSPFAFQGRIEQVEIRVK
jgi:arylsulfatase